MNSQLERYLLRAVWQRLSLCVGDNEALGSATSVLKFGKERIESREL